MDHPTSDPTVTDDLSPVRADLGGWLSGPCLAAPLAPEPVQPSVLKTVLAVARLGQELPSWRIAETSAGWTGVRAAVDSDGATSHCAGRPARTGGGNGAS